jgi:hypothetical protein
LYVNWSVGLVGLEPPALVTTTSTVPEPGGATAVITVSVLLVMLAGADPNTTVAPVKFMPVIVTVVPPAAGPDVGLIDVTVGGGGLPPML